VGCFLLLLLLLLLWFIFFYTRAIIAISGYTNATLVINGCLEKENWETVETNLSIKTTYWNKISQIETNNPSQTSGKNDELFVTPLHRKETGINQ
jgi:hypothetical protein